MQEVIAMMVGRELTSEVASGGRAEADREVVLEVDGLSHEGAARRRQLHAAPRRDPRLRRADGRGPHRGRARDRRRGPDRAPGRSGCAAARSASARRPRPRAIGIGYLSEDRKQFGLLLEQDVNAEHRAERAGRALPALGLRPRRRDARPPPSEFVDTLRIKTPSVTPDGQEPLRRQPAEGRHRQVAGQGLRHPHLRRADAGHRRRRQGGDLPACSTSSPPPASRSS